MGDTTAPTSDPGHDLSSYDRLPDSRQIRPPTVDERVRDLEVAYDARARELLDMSKRLRAVEEWPKRLVVAVIVGALGMSATVIGASWSLSSQLSRTEAAVDALTLRIERLEAGMDRLEERQWDGIR